MVAAAGVWLGVGVGVAVSLGVATLTAAVLITIFKCKDLKMWVGSLNSPNSVTTDYIYMSCISACIQCTCIFTFTCTCVLLASIAQTLANM